MLCRTRAPPPSQTATAGGSLDGTREATRFASNRYTTLSCPRGKNSDLVRGKQRLPTLLQAADKKVAPR